MYQRKIRKNNETREIKFQKNLMENAYANILIQCGKTKILCTASVDEKVPPFLDETKTGWVTAEYNMLPGSTLTRKSRSIYRPDSRGIEIQRIIARALRAAVDLTKIPGYSIIIDCDVIQADGGTRTASITGGYVALEMAVKKMLKEKLIKKSPLIHKIASISAGIVDGQVLLDLDYNEDRQAEADINIVMNEKGNIIEIQGTGEKGDISKENLLTVLDYSEQGIKMLFEKQREILENR